VVGAVFLDVGETLVDETRHWAFVARVLGVSTFTLFGALGSLIEQGRHHHEVFSLFRPGADLEAVRAELRAAGGPPPPTAEDLYPDAVPCLHELRTAGLRVGLVGNQPASIERALRDLQVPFDFVASSESWGLAKPAPEFFARVVAAAGRPCEEIAYVGDRLDNDVLPARRAGMVGVFLRRGPWGVVHAQRPEAAHADLRIESLSELLPGLRALAR